MLRNCNNHLHKKSSKSDIPLDISSVCPNTVDNDVMYLTHAYSYSQQHKNKHSSRN